MVSKFLSILNMFLNDCSDKSYYAEGKYKTELLMLTIFSSLFLYKVLLFEILCCDKMMFIIHCHSSFFKNFKDAVCQILCSVVKFEFTM